MKKADRQKIDSQKKNSQNKYRTTRPWNTVVFTTLVLAGGLCSYFYLHRTQRSQPNFESGTTAIDAGGKSPVNSCMNPQYETEHREMKDGTMKGLINPGDKYTVTQGWYMCNPVHRGDIVDYVYNYNLPAVPRLVHAVPGDSFRLVKNPKRKAWNLQVNGHLATQAQGAEPHYFGNQDVPTVLSLFEKSMKGVLPASSFIIFTTVSPGRFDSEMGVVNSGDFRGKVELLRK